MLTKADINALFGTKGLTLDHMYSKACECLEREKKQDILSELNKHGDIETFCSTSDTRLRVLKMGDETQLHLESAKKMKLD